jgi:riboflavin biosynthesis pyrimidine reductase
MPRNARWLNDDGTRRIVVRSAACDSAGSEGGADVLGIAPRGGELCPRDIVAALYELGLKRFLIEGGAWTVSRFIDAGAVDRLHVLVAPVILGSGKTGLDLAEIDTLADAKRPDTRAYVLDDGEVLFDCDLGKAG